MRRIAVAVLLLDGSVRLLAQGGSAHGLALFRFPSDWHQAYSLKVDRETYRSIEALRGDLGLARLLAAGLNLESTTAEAIKALVPDSPQGAAPIRWLLVGPGRKVLATGTGLPSVVDLEGALRTRFGALPWDAMEAVLKAQPDHGEARLAMAEWTIALTAPPTANEPFSLWRWGLFRPERFQADANASLDALLAIPGWPAQVDLNGTNPAQLGPRLKQLSLWFKPRIKRMADEALAALTLDPENPLLQTNLAFLLGVLDRDGAERLMVDLEEVTPLPGQDWPPLPLIHAQSNVLSRAERWRELRLRAEAWSRPANQLYLGEKAWKLRLLREATLLAYASLARNQEEGWEVLPELLTGLRKATGSHFGSLANMLLARGRLPPDPDLMKEIRRLAALPPLASPPRPPGIPPWRVAVHGIADLAQVRETFDTHPRLCLWLPMEREFLAKSSPGWDLQLGFDRVDGGTDLASLAHLPDLMAKGRRGRLFEAWTRVEQEPDSPGPRKLRIGLLTERRHVKGLESYLAEDLRRVLNGAEILDWPLDENLWFAEAQRAVPALEEHLSRWPLDEARWAGLAFWSGFLPRHPGPVQLATELPSWRAGLPFLLCLPAAVHDRIGRTLRERGAWGAARAWFQAAWEGLNGLKRDHPFRLQLVAGLGSVLHAHLDEAYGRLGLAGPRRVLGEAWRDLREQLEAPKR